MNSSIDLNNSYLTIVERVMYAPGFVTAPLNIIICTIFAILCFSDKKRFHPNFCILRIHLIVAFYLNAITHFIIITTVFIENTTMPIRYFDIWFNSVVIGCFATELMRYSWIAIFIERSFATFYSHNYENEVKRFIWLPITLTIFAYTAAIIWSYLRFYINVSIYITDSWSLIFDFIGVISIYILHWLNRRRRKLKSYSNVKLSQRYQIVENIRILKIIFPIIITGICFTLFGTIIRFTTTQIDSLKWLFLYAMVIYYVSLNVFELIALILWVRRDARYQKKIRSFYNKFMQSKTCDHSTVSNQFVLTNVEGNVVCMEQNTTAHFSTLDLMWKESSFKNS